MPVNWTPAALGSSILKLWLQGDLVTGSNGDTIQTWSDSSGNGNDATQATSGKRPTLAAADLNSMNTIRFTSANATSYGLPNLMSGATQAALVCLYKVVNDPAISDASSGGLIKIGGATAGSAANHWPYSDGQIYDDFGVIDRQDLPNPTLSLSSTYRIISLRSAALTGGPGTGEYHAWLDGVSLYSNGATPAFTSTPEIGHFASGATQIYFNGWCPELILCNSALGTSDRQKCEGYLAWKWALTGNLDSGHPYKSAAPTIPDSTLTPSLSSDTDLYLVPVLKNIKAQNPRGQQVYWHNGLPYPRIGS